MKKQLSEKRKILIALGITLGIVVVCAIIFYFIANAIVLEECSDLCMECPAVRCEHFTLWESIFGR